VRARLGPMLAPATAFAACATAAALHQPRPALAAFASFVAVAGVARRHIALLVCLLVAIGLIATTNHNRFPSSHDRAPSPRRHHHTVA
jgi:hypothetical protein